MLLLLLLPLVAVFASAGQLPFAFDNAGGAKSQRKPGEPEDLYIKHCALGGPSFPRLCVFADLQCSPSDIRYGEVSLMD